jgi:hypothetical protein
MFNVAVSAADYALYNATPSFGEGLRCGGDESESEGSVLKYVTEGENAVGAAD